MLRFWLVWQRWVAFAALAAALAAVPALAADNAPAPASGEAPGAVAGQDSEARDILMNMAGFLAKAPAFGVTVRSSYDAIQADGQRIEFGEKRRISLQRPDRVRVDAQRSDGEGGVISFDGRALTVYKADDNVFAQVDRNGTVDDIIVYMVRDLQMTLPLARMFLSTFPQDLEKLATRVSYVEEDVLFDVPTDHLAVRSPEVDMQVWVAQGELPLPRRVVITYRTAPGEPQFRAELSDWSLAPGNPESASFTPPKDAERIPFLARVRPKGSLPAQTGGAQ